MRTAPAAILAALVLALAGCGGGEGDGEAATAADTAAASAAGCRDVEAPEPRAEGTLEPPTAILDVDRTHRVAVRTSCGSFTITLDPDASPRAATSFAALAERGFYDETVFHRIVPGFVIQGGDPTATGSGGPGYTTEDVPAGDTTYPAGTVAMAKTAVEPAGTAGSQFFVVTADGVTLPPDYAVVGHVTAGMNVVDRIAVLGDPATELPTQPVVVEEMTLSSEG